MLVLGKNLAAPTANGITSGTKLMTEEPQPAEEIKTQMQSAKLLEDFAGHFDELASILLEYEADTLADQPCQCGRHLNQSQRTLDVNFQCNQFTKNTDPDDVSLCAGKGYFPLDSEYKEYLARVPISKEKSTCNYLKAVNNQDKKKFKNMAITGTINCQCSHVFILSCVDLYYGERFANTDKALAMELRQHQPTDSFKVSLHLEVEDVDQATTYDIACEYFVHLEERFENNFPDLVPMIKCHQDSCTYLFGTAYMECVGHFHGETAEQYWPEANQLGPHVRQMNNGHRQDTMIHHHGDWNHKKMMNMEDIREAKTKYVQKRNHFIQCSPIRAY
ncbi:hypothetical protein B0H10DRAFT_1966261 [Mycena sp. CBHHK59/15]|nr:hypothetical protein B0H10DRAFT_1966261 [Mycena sp. CBHHK59/15]